MARIVSIDIGTSRIKVALFDETGNMNSLLSRPVLIPRASPRHAGCSSMVRRDRHTPAGVKLRLSGSG